MLLVLYIKVLDEKEEYENIVVSEGKIGTITACDLTVDGILIRSGVPLFFKYGGLVQMVNNKPLHFTEMISYERATMSTLELVRSIKLSVARVMKTGSGLVPAGLREIVAEAREDFCGTSHWIL